MTVLEAVGVRVVVTVLELVEVSVGVPVRVAVPVAVRVAEAVAPGWALPTMTSPAHSGWPSNWKGKLPLAVKVCV